MNGIDILKFLGDYGARFQESEIPAILDYIEKMMRDDRVLILENHGLIKAVLFYAILEFEDIERMHDRFIWKYMPHRPTGNICYVEKLVSMGWTHGMRREIEKFLVSKYPKIEYGVWHRDRDGVEKVVMIKRREYVSN